MEFNQNSQWSPNKKFCVMVINSGYVGWIYLQHYL